MQASEEERSEAISKLQHRCQWPHSLIVRVLPHSSAVTEAETVVFSELPATRGIQETFIESGLLLA